MSNILTDEMFQDALFKEDELGSVVRVHLHIEHHINEIISLLVPYPDELKPIKLDYDGKLNLICALGVKPEFKKVLSALGSMRNKFAHNPFYKLDKDAINSLYDCLRPEDKVILKNAHEKNRKNFSPVIKSYNELPSKDQFILIAIVVRNIVLGIKNDINSQTV